jgi:salicylate hydroxylase
VLLRSPLSKGLGASMSKCDNISIIGGGIGGLAAAIALLKRGISVQVYERAHELRAVGAGLTLSPNGLNSLEAIQPGIAQALKDAGSEVSSLTMKRASGETIISRQVALAPRFGQPMLNITWSRLQSILASALPPGVIRLNHRCERIEQSEGGVTVYFDNGEEASSDALIGADGINSAVRQALIGDGPPAYAGRMSWRALIRYPHKDLIPNGSTGFTSPDGKNMMLFDMGEGCTCWSAGAITPGGRLSESPGEVKERVRNTYAGWADLVVQMIEATPSEDIVERTISDRPPLRQWTKGRVTLLGDAAHPVVPALGQGANMAFEDAYELAERLASSPGLEMGLRAYEASRIPRTEAISLRSAKQGFSSYKPDSDETLARTVAEISEDEFQVWLYGYRPGAGSLAGAPLSNAPGRSLTPGGAS